LKTSIKLYERSNYTKDQIF